MHDQVGGVFEDSPTGICELDTEPRLEGTLAFPSV